MSFAPILPIGGLAGLRLLDETADRQRAFFERGPEIARDIAQFEARAGEIETLDDLMGDTRVLRVVLGAYVLQEELPRRAFVRKVIEEGTLDPGAFANRLANRAFRQLAEDLGFGNFGNRLVIEDVREDILARYRERAFEQAVGERDVDLRLALNFRREIVEIAGSEAVETSGWLQVLGSQPMRRVIETAFGLPQQFALLDLDQQVAELESLSRRRFGEASPAALTDPVRVEELVRDFLLRAQIQAGASGAAGAASATAVQILQAGGLGSGGAAGLVLSNLL